MAGKRIFLIHATPLAIAPITQAFARLWPEAILANLLEDSLSRDLAAAGELTEALKLRFLALARYAAQAGADGILFTCSSFGDAIDLCKHELSIPVLKPNEAMIEEAISKATRIAIVATFAPAIDSMASEFTQAAQATGSPLTLTSFICAEAFEVLQAGQADRHDQLIGDLVGAIEDQDIVCFAQFSMISAAAQASAATPLIILTTPNSAVLKLRASLHA